MKLIKYLWSHAKTAPKPWFGHIRDMLFKNKKKKYKSSVDEITPICSIVSIFPSTNWWELRFQWGMKLNLSTNLVLNWVCIVLSFLECFQLISVVVMCTITINVFKPSALNFEFQYLVEVGPKVQNAIWNFRAPCGHKHLTHEVWD